MKQLLEIILARLNTVPVLRDVRLFNNQLQKLEKNETIHCPAVLVEMLNVEYESFNGGSDVQVGTCTIKVHIVDNSPLQGKEMDIYALKHTVHQYLHRFDGDHFNPLVRTEEQLDQDHDSVYDYQITYTIRFAEETTPLPDDTATFLFDYTADLTAENSA